MDALPKPKLDRDRSIAWDFILENDDMETIIKMSLGEDPLALLHNEFKAARPWGQSLRAYLRQWQREEHEQATEIDQQISISSFRICG